MNYQQAWTFLDNLQFFKIKLGLDSIRQFLSRVGNPQQGLRYLHLAGTNGKGSVGAALVGMLGRAGYRAGWYTSPHLSCVRERFKINDRYISEEEFARHATSVRDVLGENQITYFEFATAVAFLWFAEQKVDFVVLETGMGGRLDATNVIVPEVSVITNVAMDHEIYLGTTLTAIAGEKAGVVKQGVPVVSAAADDEGRAAIEAVCRERGARLLLFGRDFELFNDGDGTFSYRGISGQDEKLSGLRFSLAGAHQRCNMAVALAALEVLLGGQLYGEPLRSAARDALGALCWPGRLELLELDRFDSMFANLRPGRRRMLLDGAHNPAGVQALSDALRTEFSFDRLFLVWGAMQDKDIAGALGKIAPLANRIFLARPKGERAAAAEFIRSQLPEAQQVAALCFPDTHGALAAALAEATAEDLICIAGSLYLVGEARRLLIGELVDHA